jgi:hypothetical protein
MEQDRVEKGQARAEVAVLAALDRASAPRQDPAKDKAGVAAGAALGRAAGVKARAVALAEAVERETQIKKGGTTMPGRNGTGPMGMGPMTGRAAGYCAGFGTPGFASPMGGRGCGMGFGRGRGAGGRGFRNMFHATGLTGWQRAAVGLPLGATVSPPVAAPTRDQQLDALKGQATCFEGALGELRKRIEELESEKAEK